MLEYTSFIDGHGDKKETRRPTAFKRTDPEYHVHQIPLVESGNIKTNNYPAPPPSRQRHDRAIGRRLAAVGCSALLIALFQLRSSISSTAGTTALFSWQEGTIDVADRRSSGGLARFLALKRLLLEHSVSGEGAAVAALADGNSPQFRALDWMANTDLRRVDLRDDSPHAILQRYALAVIYFATNGKSWERQHHWLSERHECDWNDGGGVRSCDNEKRVTDISLWNNLQGKIPDEIGHLSSLKVLYISRNKLSGTLPETMGKISNLTYLGLQHNNLRGTVPTILGLLTNLEHLMIQKNDLTGTLARGVHPLCSLRNVDVGAGGGGGKLKTLTADCRGIDVGSEEHFRAAELECDCCTQCYRY